MGSEMKLFAKCSKEDSRYRLFSFTFIPGKVMEQISLEPISSRMKTQKGTRNSQHKAMRG